MHQTDGQDIGIVAVVVEEEDIEVVEIIDVKGDHRKQKMTKNKKVILNTINQKQKRNLADKVTTEEEVVEEEAVEAVDFIDVDHDHEVKDPGTNILHKMKGVMMKMEIPRKGKGKIDLRVADLRLDVTGDLEEDQDDHLHKVLAMKVIAIVTIVIENIVMVIVMIGLSIKEETNMMVKTVEVPKEDMDGSEEVAEEVVIEERERER